METNIDIKQLRSDLGETQEKFGARFGVTQPAVMYWERNGMPRSKLVRDHIAKLRARTPYRKEAV